MRVAIIHDWLVTNAGAERVLEQLINLYPQADLFTIVDFMPADMRGFLKNKVVNTSFIQHLPKARTHYRSYLPFMPLAVEQFDLSGYDLVISSSHAVAKGIITGPDQVHISYVHSPIRYAWDMQGQYLKQAGLNTGLKGFMAKVILHYIRMWDYRTAAGVDYFIANSHFIAKRIKKCYRREAKVIYPPVDIMAYSICERKEDFYLTASRMVPYKNVKLIVEAFNKMPNRKLVVIGDGTEYQEIIKIAKANIVVLGYQPFEVLRDYMQRASAFVFAAKEDFGITPVEAQACGTPVIAYGKGGSLETVKGLDDNRATGVFFYQQDVKSICQAVDAFEKNKEKLLPGNCRKNAEEFSIKLFHDRFSSFVHQIEK